MFHVAQVRNINNVVENSNNLEDVDKNKIVDIFLINFLLIYHILLYNSIYDICISNYLDILL